MSTSTLIFLSGMGVAVPVLMAWVKVWLWKWLDDQENS